MKKRIGLIGDNSIKYVDILLNILLSGDTAVLMDWRIPLNVSLNILQEVGVHECFLESKKFKTNCLGEKINLIMYENEQNAAKEIPLLMYEKYRIISKNLSNTDALVFFSSGTTGKAKGIRLSFSAINNNVDAIIEYMKPKKNDTILITKSMSHSSTLIGELFVGLKSSSKLIVAPTTIHPSIVLKNIMQYNVSIWCLNPTLLCVFSKLASRGTYNINSLKRIYISGSIASKQILLEANERFKNVLIINMYGLTEAGPRVTVQRSCAINKFGSVGSPVNGVKIKIIAEDRKELSSYLTGIVHVKSSSIMNGYLNGKCRKSLYNDWLNTGDLGFIDDDGDLYIVGRVDNMILQGSHKVYPEEVEIKLKQHKLIDDCIVFGVKHDIYGERIICLYLSGESIKNIELRRYCANLMAPYEIPSEFLKVKMLPYNSNGKLERYKAKKMYEEEFLRLCQK